MDYILFAQLTEDGHRGRNGLNAVPGAVKDNRNEPVYATIQWRSTEANLAKDRLYTRPNAFRLVRVSPKSVLIVFHNKLQAELSKIARKSSELNPYPNLL